jgi:ribonuclease VapC
MIVDTSAIIAIVFSEAEASDLLRKLGSAGSVHVSAATLLETFIVLSRRTKSRDARELDKFIDIAKPHIVPFDG